MHKRKYRIGFDVFEMGVLLRALIDERDLLVSEGCDPGILRGLIDKLCRAKPERYVQNGRHA